MATYNLNAANLEQLIANLHLSGGVVSALDTALIESKMYPTGNHTLPVDVNNGTGMETLSLSDSIGLFIETGSNVQDTITFAFHSGHDHDHDHDEGRRHDLAWGGADTLSSAEGGRRRGGDEGRHGFGRDDDDHDHDTLHGSGGGHVIVAGDGDSVSIYDQGSRSDTLIAGYQDTLSIHQTLSVQSGNNLLIGGLFSNVYDTLNAGSGNDTLAVYSGHNVLNAAGGHTTLIGGSGSDTLNLGGEGSRDLVNSGSGAETINVATGGDDTINGFSAGQTQVYINSQGQTVNQSKHGQFDVYNYGHGASSTTVDVLHGSATVHFS